MPLTKIVQTEDGTNRIVIQKHRTKEQVLKDNIQLENNELVSYVMSTIEQQKDLIDKILEGKQ